MAKSIIQEKSFSFALEMIEPFKQLQAEREFGLSKQLLRSGTSIGANVEEALAGQSRKDFMAKMAVASKEAREARYWLVLLQKSKLTKNELNPALRDVDELIRILTSIVKTTAETPATQNSKFKIQNSGVA
ncbi:MAG TPA: four helix bundle protein [Candidatus Acidoferrum sp.]|nr:four helix bundle protein [Candidatus Acidoferrum sp.]